jgi:hypothetical protein
MRGALRASQARLFRLLLLARLRLGFAGVAGAGDDGRVLG